MPLFYFFLREEGSCTETTFYFHDTLINSNIAVDALILIDSHIHEPHGALIAFANTNDVWDLLQFYHDLTGHPYTLGTVTKVSF